jgi:hypothetical protein
VPHGFNEQGNPTSLTFVGRVFGEVEMLALSQSLPGYDGLALPAPEALISQLSGQPILPEARWPKEPCG